MVIELSNIQLHELARLVAAELRGVSVVPADLPGDPVERLKAQAFALARTNPAESIKLMKSVGKMVTEREKQRRAA